MFEESKFVKKQKEAMACTMTGEPYQPVRLYYQIKQKNALLGRFKRLRCIDFAPTKNCWVWLYHEEAKKLKFTKSYGELPKEYRPIILGYLRVKNESELLVDVRSFQRGIQAILFFDQKINRRLARLEKMRIVNKLFPASISQSEMWGHHREFFEEREVVNPQEKVKELLKIAEEQEERKRKELLESHSNSPRWRSRSGIGDGEIEIAIASGQYSIKL